MSRTKHSSFALLARLSSCALALVASGCGLIAAEDDEGACSALPATQPENLRTLPWLQIGTPEGFCPVVAAYQYQIYNFSDVPMLIADIDGYDGEWTFPSDVKVTPLSSGGADVQWGLTSGEVCGRRWNDCTEPGEYACYDVEVVTENVFAPVRTEVTELGEYGAMAVADGAVWYLMPKGRYGVFRIDPETKAITQVSDSFPVGREDDLSYTGGKAITVGTDIWYLANARAFRFDTQTSSWDDGIEVEHSGTWPSPSVVYDGKLWVFLSGLLGQGGGLIHFDPATQQTTNLEIAGAPRQGMVAFVRGEELVFGAGYECDERELRCWKQDFLSFDPAVGSSGSAQPSLPPNTQVTAALDFEDRTVVVTLEGEAFVLLDSSDAWVELEENPAFPDCALVPSPPGAVAQSAITYQGEGYILGGAGAFSAFTVYRP